MLLLSASAMKIGSGRRQRQKVAHVLLVHTSSSHYDTGCSTLSDVHESGLAWYCVEVPDKHTEHAYLR